MSIGTGTRRIPGDRWRRCCRLAKSRLLAYQTLARSCSRGSARRGRWSLLSIRCVAFTSIMYEPCPGQRCVQYEPDELELMAQVELHPFNPQHGLKKYCDDRGILLQAYSPLGSQGMHACTHLPSCLIAEPETDPWIPLSARILPSSASQANMTQLWQPS